MSEKDYADIGLPKVRELEFFLSMYIFAVHELTYHLNVRRIRVCGLDFRRSLEFGLRSSSCLRGRSAGSFPEQRLVIELIDDTDYRTYLFQVDSTGKLYGFRFN